MSYQEDQLKGIADAIREKKKTGAAIQATQFPAEIRSIPTLDTSDATATAAAIRSGYTAYAKDAKLTGTLADYTGATAITPSASTQTLATAGKYVGSNITVNPGLSSADATATAAAIRSGYTAYVNNAKISGTMPTYSGATYVYPSTSTQTLNTNGCYMNDKITIYPQSSAFQYNSGSVRLSTSNGNISSTYVYVGFYPSFIAGWRRSEAGNWYGWIVTPGSSTITMDNLNSERQTYGWVSRSSDSVTFCFRNGNNALLSSGTDIYWYAAGT